jgi:hypothetical protein
MAGTTSSASWTHSPIRCIWPAQHGQTVLSGSMICSQRGRCLGSAPFLRRAGLRNPFDEAFGFTASSSLAASGGGGMFPLARSPSPSVIWASIRATRRSDLAPKCRALIERNVARSRSLSAASRNTSSATRSGSAGRSSRRNGRIAPERAPRRQEQFLKLSDQNWFFHDRRGRLRPCQSVEQQRQLRR